MNKDILENKLRYEENVGFSYKLIKELGITYLPIKSDKEFDLSQVPQKIQKDVEKIQNELQLEGYALLKYSGQGSQGIVVIAKQGNVRYAIKSLKIVNSYGERCSELIKQAEKEINLMRSFKSEYIVSYITSFMGKHHYHIVMEECLGTLDDIYKLSGKKLNENTFIKYGIEILQGMRDVQESNVVLRDLKPENILINYQNKAKLSDFGLSVELQQECWQSFSPDIAHIIKTTLEERLEQKTTKQQNYPIAKQGIRSDIYSLGLIFINLLGCTSIELYQKKNRTLQEDFVPNIDGYRNKELIKEVIKGLNQYLPQDRMSIQDALQIFKQMEYTIKASEFEQLITPQKISLKQFIDPESINIVYQQDVVAVDSDKILPHSLFQHSSNLELCKNNLMEFDRINQTLFQNQYAEFIFKQFLSLIPKYISKDMPIQNMNIQFIFYETTIGILFIFNEDCKKKSLRLGIKNENMQFCAIKKDEIFGGLLENVDDIEDSFEINGDTVLRRYHNQNNNDSENIKPKKINAKIKSLIYAVILAYCICHNIEIQDLQNQWNFLGMIN